MGGPNDAYAAYFVGQSFLNMLTTEGVPIGNVTFEPGCRNNWHIHKADKGGGQILLCTNGRGWYQEWGREVRELFPGDVVVIPTGVKHWHAQQRIAGLHILPWKFPEKMWAASGWSRWTKLPMLP